ncbi:unnamed protein product, partial [Pylaiella littoralis]
VLYPVLPELRVGSACIGQCRAPLGLREGSWEDGHSCLNTQVSSSLVPTTARRKYELCSGGGGRGILLNRGECESRFVLRRSLSLQGCIVCFWFPDVFGIQQLLYLLRAHAYSRLYVTLTFCPEFSCLDRSVPAP